LEPSVFAAFDRIVIDVADPESATTEYQALLGLEAAAGEFDLGNLRITLNGNDTATQPRLDTLSLLDPGLENGAQLDIDTGPRNIPLARSHFREPTWSDQPTETGIYAVDHIVLQTRDADDCIRLFRDELGIRLALDQEVPEWGGRMLFFRMGKMTLEVIQNLKQPPEQDFFWGITYLCKDIEQTTAELDRRGVAHSPIRPGRKPGTRVATVKSHCLGLPTLLVGPG
jgi:catechol 2,3-dioxygenase-like lactoylglutathione lyase family enzyme